MKTIFSPNSTWGQFEDPEKVWMDGDEMVVPWRTKDGFYIELQTPEQVAALAEGTVLRSISDRVATVGTDDVDLDTLGGRTAWGLPDRRGF